MSRARELLSRVREIKGEEPVSRAEELLRKVGRLGGVARLPGIPGANPLNQYQSIWNQVAREAGVPPSKMKLGRFDAQPEYEMKARKGRYAVSLQAAEPLFDWSPDLRWFDLIIANTSGGKDSMVMLDRLMGLAEEQGVLDRVWVLHADLGELEHQGVGQLVQKHAQAYGMKQRLRVVERTTHGFHKDLLERFEDRLIAFLEEPKKGFPGWGTRYCTSEFKTGEVKKWVNDYIRTTYGPSHVNLVKKYGRRVRVLQVLGLRTEESGLRAGPGFKLDKAQSRPTRKETYTWLPVQGLRTKQVWGQLKRLKKKGIPYHLAYDVGFKRLSCRLCPLAGNEDVMLGALIYPKLTERIIALQRAYGKPFKQSTTLEQLRDKALKRPDLVAKAAAARKVIKEPEPRPSRMKGKPGPRGPRII